MTEAQTLKVEVPYYEQLDNGTEINMHVIVTYLPHPGTPDYFDAKAGCWYPGDDAQLEILEVAWCVDETPLIDPEHWAEIAAKVVEELQEDDQELWEHFTDVMLTNADKRDEANGLH